MLKQINLIFEVETLAVVTTQTTSPRWAAIRVPKEDTTALVKPSLVTRVNVSELFLVNQPVVLSESFEQVLAQIGNLEGLAHSRDTVKLEVAADISDLHTWHQV